VVEAAAWLRLLRRALAATPPSSASAALAVRSASPASIRHLAPLPVQLHGLLTALNAWAPELHPTSLFDPLRTSGDALLARVEAQHLAVQRAAQLQVTRSAARALATARLREALREVRRWWNVAAASAPWLPALDLRLASAAVASRSARRRRRDAAPDAPSTALAPTLAALPDPTPPAALPDPTPPAPSADPCPPSGVTLTAVVVLHDAPSQATAEVRGEPTD